MIPAMAMMPSRIRITMAVAGRTGIDRKGFARL